MTTKKKLLQVAGGGEVDPSYDVSYMNPEPFMGNAWILDFFDANSYQQSKTLKTDTGAVLPSRVRNESFHVTQDGNHAYYIESSNPNVLYHMDLTAHRYHLGTNSNTPDNKFELTDLEDSTDGKGIYVSPDGQYLFVGQADGGVSRIYRFIMPTAFDPSSITATPQYLDLTSSGPLTNPTTTTAGQYGFNFKPDGTRLFFNKDVAGIVQVELSTAWDLSSYSSDDINTTIDLGTTYVGCEFSHDGSLLFFRDTSTAGNIGVTKLSVPWNVIYQTDAVARVEYDIYDMTILNSIVAISVAGPNLYFSSSTTNDPVRVRGIGGWSYNAWSGQDLYHIIEDMRWSHDGKYLTLMFTDSAYQRFDTFQSFEMTNVNRQTPDTRFRDIIISPDGTKMWYTDRADVREGTLSEPNQLHTFRLNENYITDNAYSMAWNDDGTIFYTVWQTSDYIYQYSASTAYDISSLTLTEAIYAPTAINASATQPEKLQFNNDGSKAYLLNLNNDTIYEIHLDSAYDLNGSSDITSQDSLSVSTANSSLTKTLLFNDDGTKLYLIGPATTDPIEEWTTTTPYSISTYSANQVFSLSGDLNMDDPYGACWVDDGNSIVLTSNSEGNAIKFALDTAYTLQNLNTEDHAVLLNDINPNGSDLTTDGGTNSDRVGTLNIVSPNDTGLSGFSWNDDGTELFIIGDTYDELRAYTVATAYHPQGATRQSSKDYDYTVDGITQSRSLEFSPDGTKMYILDYVETIHEYTLSTAWNPSTATEDRTLDVSSEVSNAYGIRFSPDGKKLFVSDSVGTVDGTLHQYALTTAWNISTATLDKESYPLPDYYHYCFTFGSDGLTLWHPSREVSSPTETYIMKHRFKEEHEAYNQN